MGGVDGWWWVGLNSTYSLEFSNCARTAMMASVNTGDSVAAVVEVMVTGLSLSSPPVRSIFVQKV